MYECHGCIHVLLKHTGCACYMHDMTLQHTASRCNTLDVSYIDTLQHTATHHIKCKCNTLQHALQRFATLRNTLQHTGCVCCMYDMTLQHAATRCNTLHVPYLNTLQHCNTLQYSATRCNTLQHTTSAVPSQPTTHCNTLQHAATLCNTLQHSTTLCNTLQHSRRVCSMYDMTPSQVCRDSVLRVIWLIHMYDMA